MKAAIYVRVSTEDQDVENQSRQLRSLCDARGWPMIVVYRDNASGADPARLAFNDMMRDARGGVFDVLVFWAWDRITRRGIAAALSIMDKWKSWGLRWESLQEPFLSSGADPHMAELLLSIVSWAAKQERLLISQRTKAGLARRAALGLQLGRRLKFPWRDEEIHAIHLGIGHVPDTARILGVSRDKVYKVLRRPEYRVPQSLEGSPRHYREESG